MFKKTLAAAAVLILSAAGAMAADVTIYGRIDTGLQYNHSDPGVGDASDTLKMHTGQHDANRLGLKGAEKISGGLTVGFQLENGFNSDDGTLKNNNVKHEGDTLFDREAQLYVSGAFGQVGFGRMGLLRSGAGSYNLLGDVSAMTTGWGSVGDQSVLLADVGTNRMDNTIVYRTPKLAGFQVHAQYSMGGSTSTYEAVENESSSDRYYGLGITYAQGGLKAVALVDTMNERSLRSGVVGDREDMKSVSLAVNYDFGVARAYLLGQYFKDADGVGGLPGVSSSKITGDEIKGYALLTGVKVPAAGGSFRFTVGYMKAEDKGAVNTAGEDDEVERFLVGTGYDYPLSKSTMVYCAAGYWQDDYSSRVNKVDDASNFQALAGILTRF